MLLLTPFACGDSKIKAPQSDKNYDDSDDPGAKMMGSPPLDGSTDGFVPDGEGATCTAQTDCAAPLRCIFPIALGCGAKGICSFYQDPPNCTQTFACGCSAKKMDVPLCAPNGYAPEPVRSGSPCNTKDAGPKDAASDADTDGSVDAASD